MFDAANTLRLMLYVYAQAHSKKTLKQPQLFPTPDGKKLNKTEDPNSFAAVVARAKQAHSKNKEN